MGERFGHDEESVYFAGQGQYALDDGVLDMSNKRMRNEEPLARKLLECACEKRGNVIEMTVMADETSSMDGFDLWEEWEQGP